MALSNDLLDYEDIRQHFDRALASPRGIRITTESKGQAINLRQRLYKLRQLDKRASLEMYEIGDERRGVSIWEQLSVSVIDNAVLVEHRAPITVEEL